MKTHKLFLLIGFVGLSLLASSQDIYKTAVPNVTGLWNDASSWDAAGVPDLTKDIHVTISAYDTITATSTLNFKMESTLVIKKFGMLILKGGADVDLAVNKDFTIIVEDGGTLHITGDVTAKKVASFTVDGVVGVTGNINFTGNPPGTLTVGATGNLQTGGVITGLTPTIVAGGVLLQNDPTPLPIELTYFQATNNENNITLNWQTATEKNNDYFTLERSIDGQSFEIIGTVQGAGNSMTAINYSFIDNNPVNGISYYRLMQTDYDGAFEVFSPISVSYLNEGLFKFGPNPAISELNISLDGEVVNTLVKFYSQTGTLVKTVQLTGNNTSVDVSNMPKGNYMMKISSDSTIITKKVMIQ